MFEIQSLPENGVLWSPAKIDFPGYEDYKAMAYDIAKYINEVELTEDNLKEVKQTLADARKVTEGLNRRRIDIKKEINSEYSEFEKAIKELCGIIDDADQKLRDKVRKVEEAEREAKRDEIIKIWNKRVIHYRINDFFAEAWEMWLTPQHLNKSTSMKSIETDMVEWLEETEAAFNVLDNMEPEYTAEYLSCFNLAEAIKRVNNRNDMVDLARVTQDGQNIAHFIVKGEKDIKLAELLLKQNGINFEIK